MTFSCPCCGGTDLAFLPFGVRPRANARCPQCGALERHRLLALFLDRRPELLAGRPRILHLAPEAPLARRLQAGSGVLYVSGDLDASARVRLDITRLPFSGGAFDVVVCNHVLEHVPDDRGAMRELKRVLDPDGWALLQSPIDAGRVVTFEDPSVVDPRERERLFGQRDHVRQYGRDYGHRLGEEGFAVNVIPFGEATDPSSRGRFALLPEDVYLCRRAKAA